MREMTGMERPRRQYVPGTCLARRRGEFKYSGIVASPIFEVISVTIHGNSESHLFEDGKPCQVYGIIEVTDREGYTYCLYNRTETDPETVYSGGALSLSVPDNGVILPSPAVNLKVTLLDIQNRQVSRGQITLHYSSRDDYDQVISVDVAGDLGSAVLRCIAYRYATIANVKLQLLHKGGNAGVRSAIDIYGSITTHCVKPMGNQDCPSMQLFGKPAHEPLSVGFEAPIELSRPQVAVPAYCTFVLDVKLQSADNPGLTLSGTQEFNPHHSGCAQMQVQGPDYIVWMTIQWGHPYQQLLRGENLKHCLQGKVDESSSSSFSITRRSSSSATNPLDTSTIPTLQVFSVSVHRFDGITLPVHGRISVNDYEASQDGHVLFEKEKDSPDEVLPSRRHIVKPLGGPPQRVSNDNMEVNVSLKDVQDVSISHGCLVWDKVAHTKFDNWLNKPLCAVIRGKHGYAAVHHALLTDAVLVKLRAFLVPKDSDSSVAGVHLSGYLAFEYDTFEYSSMFDRKYFTDKSYMDGLKDLDTGRGAKSEILLTKAAFSVRRNAAVSMDLYARVRMVGRRRGFESLKVKPKRFQIDAKQSQEEIFEGGNYFIQVCASW